MCKKKNNKLNETIGNYVLNTVNIDTFVEGRFSELYLNIVPKYCSLCKTKDQYSITEAKTQK